MSIKNLLVSKDEGTKLIMGHKEGTYEIYTSGNEIIVQAYEQAKPNTDKVVNFLKNFGIESPFDEKEFRNGKEDDLIQHLFETAELHYRKKSAEIAEMVLPVVRDVYKNPNNNFENIEISKSNNPKPWPIHKNYNIKPETQNLKKIHTELETVAYLIIKNGMIENKMKY